jgi:hypothetical protein
MPSSFLEGLAREPSASVLQQVNAWDESDVLLKALSTIQSTGEKFLPAEARERIGELARKTSDGLGIRGSEDFVFIDPLDPHLMKIARVCNHFGEMIAQEPGYAFLEHAALRVEKASIDLLLKSDERSIADRLRRRPRQGFSGSSILDATRYILSKLFDQIQEQFESLSDEERRRAAEELVEAIDRLDPETQAQIRQRLDIDRLGAEALLKSGAVASIGTGLGAAVAIGGFGSYALLTSTIATVAGFFGLTLPFKFYILATSGLAFLANPIVLGAAALGGGWMLRKQANRAIRDRYVTVLVALSVVGQGNPTPDPDPARSLVEHAKRRYREFSTSPEPARSAYVKAFPAFRRGPTS